MVAGRGFEPTLAQERRGMNPMSSPELHSRSRSEVFSRQASLTFASWELGRFFQLFLWPRRFGACGFTLWNGQGIRASRRFLDLSA